MLPQRFSLCSRVEQDDVWILHLKIIFAALQASHFQVALQLPAVLNMKTIAGSHAHFNQASLKQQHLASAASFQQLSKE